MKKLKVSGLLFIIFMALAFTAGEDEKVDSSSGVSKTTTVSNTPRSYIPSIPNVFRSEGTVGTEFNVKEKKTSRNLSTGKGPGQIGVSKEEEELPPMGPGSFAYSKNKKAFIVLDNQNNRINFYPEDPSERGSSVSFPSQRVGLGLSVNNEGDPILLAKAEDSTGRVDHSYFEVWTLGDSTQKQPWKIQQKFSFSNRDTHYAAQSLEMQPLGDDLLFKGLSDNEFHVLKRNSNQTIKKSGFPTKDGSISLKGETQADGNRNITIQHSNNRNQFAPIRTNEDIERLNSFRVLPNGNIAMDLEADDEKQIPREVVLVDSRTGAVKARSPIQSKRDIQIDQDLYFHESSFYQMAEKPNSKKEKLGIFQTQFEDD